MFVYDINVSSGDDPGLVCSVDNYKEVLAFPPFILNDTIYFSQLVFLIFKASRQMINWISELGTGLKGQVQHVCPCENNWKQNKTFFV